MENEFRVRPVTRYNLTHYQSDENARTGGVSSIGEFDSQQQAEKVGAALQALNPGAKLVSVGGSEPEARYVQYLVVKRGYEIDTKAYYCMTNDEAERLRSQLMEHTDPGSEYRIFMRLQTN